MRMEWWALTFYCCLGLLFSQTWSSVAAFDGVGDLNPCDSGSVTGYACYTGFSKRRAVPVMIISVSVMIISETVPGTGEVARFPAETLETHKDGNTETQCN
jgi:hypothetical protein